MFTGLIKAQGVVADVVRDPEGATLSVEAELAWALSVGDSIAVNGVCLTATAVGKGRFSAAVMAQTLALTTLGELTAGRRVNLELPVAAGQRFDGHIVQGHVDGVGEVRAAVNRGFALELTIAPPQRLLRYIVPQGSIAVDGVSLTVAAVAPGSFTVSLIPETQRRTTLGGLVAGDRVNLEVDVLAKYVERLVARANGENG